MLRINRIKAISKTDSGNYGFDYSFKSGLNLVCSNINTRGKSSALLAIYYCLGFEEIVGGRGKKTLTSVYKTVVEDDQGIDHKVLESELWLEIANGNEIITIKRTAEMEGRNENLITVYHSNMENAHKSETFVEDMYVHAQNSTTSICGFHAFLEKFIGLELPLVPTNDGVEYKLYLQLLFSAMFIEQKRGWADVFSAMPVFNIKDAKKRVKDAKKRVIEFVLGLDTLSNEKKRASLKLQESSIVTQWSQLRQEMDALTRRENCLISGIPSKPCILDNDFDSKVSITTISGNASISDYLMNLEERRRQLNFKTPKIVENFDELQEELEKTETAINELESERARISQAMSYEKMTLNKLEDNMATLETDLRNNKDALKLKNMGSEIGITSYEGRCPTCGQSVQDSLLPTQNCDQTMSIDDNICHLQSQYTMIEFAIKAHRQNIQTADTTLQSLSGRLFTLRRLAKTIRSDLFSIDDNLSETVVYERISVENEIQALNKLKQEISSRVTLLADLSTKWTKYLADRKALPKSNFTLQDEDKVKQFEANFKYYLKAFNYRSVSSFENIQISRETYLPISEGFDMKFDSSASDNIRAIWSFTLALLKTSLEKGGNHPQTILFDEPGQHSIVTEDIVSLLNEIIKLPGNNQVILGITLSNAGISQAVESIEKSKIMIIDVGNHAFTHKKSVEAK